MKSRNASVSIAAPIILTVIFLIAPYVIVHYMGNYFEVNAVYHSYSPKMGVDKAGTLNVYFVASADPSGAKKTAIVKISIDGKIVDGPKTAKNSSMERYYKPPAPMTMLWLNKTGGPRYLAKVDNPDYYGVEPSCRIKMWKYDSTGKALISNKTVFTYTSDSSAHGHIWHAPQVASMQLAFDAAGSIHMVVDVNTGPSDYNRIYYEKLRDSLDVVKSSYRIKFVNSDAVTVFYLIYVAPFIIIIIAAWAYYAVSKRKERRGY